MEPVVRPSSLNLSDGREHTSCWCCPVCRVGRTHRRPQTGPFIPQRSASSAISEPSRRRTHRTSHPVNDSLPPPPPPSPPPPTGTEARRVNEESLTEVSVLSEESYFAHDEEISFQSASSFHHFEVEKTFYYPTCPVLTILHSTTRLSLQVQSCTSPLQILTPLRSRLATYLRGSSR